MVTEETHPGIHAERVVRTVLMVDVVESVRLIEDNEEDAISKWLSLVNHAEKDVLPAHGGRLVKSLGDGMLLEFGQTQSAVNAAFAIQRASHAANVGVAPERQILLRMGAQVGELIADEHDVYGRGVNLAARLMTLAGPGEIVVSAGVRDQLTPALDAEIEDLGDCHLKHVAQPVRAYRVGPPGPHPVIEPGDVDDIHPTIAIIPFTSHGNERRHQVLGEVLADEMISAFSGTTELNVISRLSTTAFRGRLASLDAVKSHLKASYVLSGGYRVLGKRLALVVELAETKSGRVIWSKELNGLVSGIVSGEDELVHQVIDDVSNAISARELQRAQSQALPTLESYSLLMGAIVLLHRFSAQDYNQARDMLEALVDRAPRRAVPHAWLAKWHVMRVWQGWSPDPKLEARLALDHTKRALDADQNCTLALAVDGLVHVNLLKRFDLAQERYEHALRVNPNDSLAWALFGTLHAFRGDGEQAMKGTGRALRLSPLDPMRAYYDSLAGTAALAARRYERAVECARRSLRGNRTHTSTHRVLAIALWELGRTEEARKAVEEVMRLDPTLTVGSYLERSPASEHETGKIWAAALRSAGVPA